MEILLNFVHCVPSSESSSMLSRAFSLAPMPPTATILLSANRVSPKELLA